MKIKIWFLSLLALSSMMFSGFDAKIHDFARKTMCKVPTTITTLLVLNFPILMILDAFKKAAWHDKEMYGDMREMLKACNENGRINFKNVNDILRHAGGPFDMPSDLESKIRNALGIKDQDQMREALNELRQSNEHYRRTIWMECFIKTLGGIGVGVGLLSGVLALKSQ